MANTGTGGEGIGRTILITPRLQEIEAILRGHGLDVMTCPPLAIQPPQSFAALDEAIEHEGKVALRIGRIGDLL